MRKIVGGIIGATIMLLVIAFLASACVTPFGMSGSAEQIHEMVKDKNAACTSITGVYMGATVQGTSVNVDKGVPPPGGTVKIKGSTCDTEITAPPKSGQ